MIERNDRNDITENALSADPTDATEANDPIEPIEHALPIEPIDKTEFFDPMHRNELSDHRDHFEEVAVGRSAIRRTYPHSHRNAAVVPWRIGYRGRRPRWIRWVSRPDSSVG